MQVCIQHIVTLTQSMTPQQSVSHLSGFYYMAQKSLFHAVGNGDEKEILYWSRYVRLVHQLATSRSLAKDMMFQVAEMTKYRG